MPHPVSPSNDYWISGYGLSRYIVLRQLQYFLGPSATGREGFLIHGPQLTKEQIEDLKRQSEQYERQQTARMSNRVSSGTEDDGCDINEIVSISSSRRHSPAESPASHYRRERHR